MQAQSKNEVFYLWNTNSIFKPLSEKTVLAFSFKTHFEAKQKEIDQNYFEGQFRYLLNSNLSVGAGYRLVREKDNENWQYENRYLTYLFYKKKSQNCDIYFTNRLSYRDFGNSNNHFRYYNKLMFILPVTLLSKTLHPFIAEELFVKLNSENVHLGRLFAGIRCWNDKKVKLDLYAAKCFQKEEPGIWDTYPLAGANLMIFL